MKLRLLTLGALFLLVMGRVQAQEQPDIPIRLAPKATQANFKSRINVTNYLPALIDGISRDYLQNTCLKAGVDAIHDLGMIRMEEDDLAMVHTHYRQFFKGIPVYGGEAILHLSRDQRDFDVTDALLSRIKVNTTAKITEAQAIEIAKKDFGVAKLTEEEPKVKVWIMRQKKTDYLVYQVDLFSTNKGEPMANPSYFVDAHTGKILRKNGRIQTASGYSYYYGKVSFTSTLSAKYGIYFEYDTVRHIGVFDAKNTTSLSSTYYIFHKLNKWMDPIANDAYYGFTKTYDFYRKVLKRKGIDGKDGPQSVQTADEDSALVPAVVHYDTFMDNAFWDGDKNMMFFGDGDNIDFGPLVSLDVCGHELTHGVTQYSSGLDYVNESGALNESFSDIMGNMVERYARGDSAGNWLVGEDVFYAGAALRFMDEPTKDGVSADYYPERYQGSDDNGGVHTNSGISNKAFYLVAHGGTHRKGGTMTGIGADKATLIFFRANTLYMTSTSTFSNARAATLRAAKALYGSTTSAEYKAVANAWKLCGVK